MSQDVESEEKFEDFLEIVKNDLSLPGNAGEIRQFKLDLGQ